MKGKKTEGWSGAAPPPPAVLRGGERVLTRGEVTSGRSNVESISRGGHKGVLRLGL